MSDELHVLIADRFEVLATGDWRCVCRTSGINGDTLRRLRVGSAMAQCGGCGRFTEILIVKDKELTR